MTQSPRDPRPDASTLKKVVAGFFSAVQDMRARKGRSGPKSGLADGHDEGHDAGLAGSGVPRRPSDLSGSGAAVAVAPDDEGYG